MINHIAHLSLHMADSTSYSMEVCRFSLPSPPAPPPSSPIPCGVLHQRGVSLLPGLLAHVFFQGGILPPPRFSSHFSWTSQTFSISRVCGSTRRGDRWRRGGGFYRAPISISYLLFCLLPNDPQLVPFYVLK